MLDVLVSAALLSAVFIAGAIAGMPLALLVWELTSEDD